MPLPMFWTHLFKTFNVTIQQVWRWICVLGTEGLPGISIVALVIFARATGTLQFMEWKLFDFYLRSRPAEIMDDRITIVGIDRADIEAMKTYPISDLTMAQLLQKIQTYQPAAIGLDIRREVSIEPGHSELLTAFKTIPNLIVAEKVLSPQIVPPLGVSSEQLGFTDFPLDADFNVRRQYLGIPITEQGKIKKYKFSFSLQLAKLYLEKKDVKLENGIRDEKTMRFGTVEIPRFTKNAGGYVNTDAGGVQVLLNYRSGKQPFRIVSLTQLKSENFDPSWVRDRIVIVGLIDPKFRSPVKTQAVTSANMAGEITGVEFQAHAVSQLLSAVLENRSFVRTWSEGWEYLWIIGWGILGIILVLLTKSIRVDVVWFCLTSGGLLVISYSLFVTQSIWIPLIPSFVGLFLGNILAVFEKYNRKLKMRIEERQQIIDRMGIAFHNGPLQTLKNLMHGVREQKIPSEKIPTALEKLNSEIRESIDFFEKEALKIKTQEDVIKVDDRFLSLHDPIHELFYSVYTVTLDRPDFSCFQTIKVGIRKFEPIEEKFLNTELKRKLCQYLEALLCNVGTHAIGATKLIATGQQKNGFYILTVEDNGCGIQGTQSIKEGHGTKISQDLEKSLQGKYNQTIAISGGLSCQFSWLLKNKQKMSGFSLRT
jgi:CHASE2 domain-containing sensor protein/two-component sensor histidine kinase